MHTAKAQSTNSFTGERKIHNSYAGIDYISLAPRSSFWLAQIKSRIHCICIYLITDPTNPSIHQSNKQNRNLPHLTQPRKERKGKEREKKKEKGKTKPP